MSLDWILLGLRLLATVILYTFLSIAFYIIWRELRQTQAQQTAILPQADQLRVIAAAEGQLLVVGQTVPLQPAIRLGFGPENKIVIDHADTFTGAICLRRQEDGWQVENLGQTTIKLNGAVLAGTRPLSHGDVIAINQTHFRFEKTKNSKK